jgi:hypothetical protein
VSGTERLSVLAASLGSVVLRASARTFWLPNARPAVGCQAENPLKGSPSETIISRGRRMSGYIWIALLLAVAAAVLSASPPGSAYQELSSLLAPIAPAADQLAGAVADTPQLAVPP